MKALRIKARKQSFWAGSRYTEKNQLTTKTQPAIDASKLIVERKKKTIKNRKTSKQGNCLKQRANFYLQLKLENCTIQNISYNFKKNNKYRRMSKLQLKFERKRDRSRSSHTYSLKALDMFKYAFFNAVVFDLRYFLNVKMWEHKKDKSAKIR